MSKQLPLLDVGPETSQKAPKLLTPKQQGQEIREAVGLYLYRARRRLGLTQLEIASSLHMRRSTITSLERGKRSLVIEELDLICGVYRISPEEIVEVVKFPKGLKRGVGAGGGVTA